MRAKPWTINEKNYVIENYLKMEYKDIGYFLGRTKDSISQFCHGNKLYKGHRKYTYNEEFFDVPTIKSTYWAGLIAADGSIDLERGVIALSLKAEDGYHVELFKEAIRYNGPIYNGFGKIKGKEYPRTWIGLNSAWPFIAQLGKHYKIGPRKSFTLGPPNIDNVDLIKSYIVGYLDGDGSVESRDRKDPFMVGFVGSFAFMCWIKKLFDEWYPAKGRVAKVTPDHNIFRYRINGKRALTILSDLSKLDVSFLKRKWDKVFERL